MGSKKKNPLICDLMNAHQDGRPQLSLRFCLHCNKVICYLIAFRFCLRIILFNLWAKFKYGFCFVAILWVASY